VTLVKTGEGQDGLVEREVSLDGSAVSEEAFIKEGEGSAFVSRPNVLVVVTASERGLPHLTKKVEQLIGRGFHNIALTLKGIERVDEDDWAAIKSALAYADQFAGWVPICGASPGLKQSLETIAKKEKKDGLLSFVKDRADAKAELRKRNADDGEGGVDPLLVQSGDATTSTESSSSSEDDWGGDWGGAPAAKKKDDGLPKVDVAELLVEADELATLRDKLGVAIKKGKKYFTLRLHFKRDRRMNEQDMHALVAARDAVARAQGQLVLAALQEDVLKWLRLLGEDRHFTIADTADDAEAMHRRHASGQVSAPAPAAAAGGEAFPVLSRDAKAIIVRPSAARGKAGVQVTTAPTRVVSVTREGLPGLAAHVKRLAGEGAKDVIVDLSSFKEIRGERFESVPAAVELAKKAGVRLAFGNVAREVRGARAAEDPRRAGRGRERHDAARGNARRRGDVPRGHAARVRGAAARARERAAQRAAARGPGVERRARAGARAPDEEVGRVRHAAAR
jgi:anti-anti-sigma regulatory factor